MWTLTKTWNIVKIAKCVSMTMTITVSSSANALVAEIFTASVAPLACLFLISFFFSFSLSSMVIQKVGNNWFKQMQSWMLLVEEQSIQLLIWKHWIIPSPWKILLMFKVWETLRQINYQKLDKLSKLWSMNQVSIKIPNLKNLITIKTKLRVSKMLKTLK